MKFGIITLSDGSLEAVSSYFSLTDNNNVTIDLRDAECNTFLWFEVFVRKESLWLYQMKQ